MLANVEEPPVKSGVRQKTPAMPVAEQKATLRAKLKQARHALPGKQRREFDRAIQARLADQADIKQAGSIFCYLSTADEVNTHPVIDRLLQLDKTVLIPEIVAREKMIAVPFAGWEALSVGQLGILTLDGCSEWQSEVDVCITPGLGFTLDGNRLGFGKGYYDKWFATNPVTLKVALCYECQIVDAIPTTGTDVSVDRIITEKRVISLQGTPG